MTETPKNIFLPPKDAALFGRKYGHPAVPQVHVGDESIQYVRKDAHDAKIKALVKALKPFADQTSCQCEYLICIHDDARNALATAKEPI